MKDKELREIMYKACEEFDRKLNFIYKQLEKLEEYGAIDMPHNVFIDTVNPFEYSHWFVEGRPNWREDLKKTKYETKY